MNFQTFRLSVTVCHDTNNTEHSRNMQYLELHDIYTFVKYILTKVYVPGKYILICCGNVVQFQFLCVL